jgi:hypothetical protein
MKIRTGMFVLERKTTRAKVGQPRPRQRGPQQHRRLGPRHPLRGRQLPHRISPHPRGWLRKQHLAWRPLPA